MLNTMMENESKSFANISIPFKSSHQRCFMKKGVLRRLDDCFYFLRSSSQHPTLSTDYRSSPPGVFLGKGDMKMCSKFKGEHPCQSAISVKLPCNVIEIALRHDYSMEGC